MNETNDIKIYKVVSVADMLQHYPAFRQLLFGMNKDNIGDISSNMNEFGTISFLNKAKLFAKFGSADKLTEADAKSLTLDFIDMFNKKIADSPYFQKIKFPSFIQKQFLKPSVITKAVNPFTKKFDHYVVTHSFIVRPLSSQDNVPVFDATCNYQLSRLQTK